MTTTTAPSLVLTLELNRETFPQYTKHQTTLRVFNLVAEQVRELDDRVLTLAFQRAMTAYGSNSSDVTDRDSQILILASTEVNCILHEFIPRAQADIDNGDEGVAIDQARRTDEECYGSNPR